MEPGSLTLEPTSLHNLFFFFFGCQGDSNGQRTEVQALSSSLVQLGLNDFHNWQFLWESHFLSVLASQVKPEILRAIKPKLTTLLQWLSVTLVTCLYRFPSLYLNALKACSDRLERQNESHHPLNSIASQEFHLSSTLYKYFRQYMYLPT